MALTLSETREVVETERRECIAEREAFDRFRRSVTRLDAQRPTRSGSPTARPGVGAGHTNTIVGAAPADAAATTLRRRYRDTVMATCPATEESLAAHVTAELGPDVAQVVCTGPVTPETRRLLLERIDVARDARDSFVTMLDREHESLDAVASACERARSELSRARSWERESVGSSFDAALSAWDRLDDVARTLDTAASERQQTLRRHRRSFAVIDDDVTEYLYGERPGLAAIASVGRELTAGRRAVTETVGRPVTR
jgi:hypothetical protein